MRLAWALPALLSIAATPAWADRKLDQAVAKAEDQLRKGKEADAVKTLEKAVSQARSDPEPALALMRLLERLGRKDEATAALAVAAERAPGASAPVRSRVRALQSAVALRTGTAAEALAFAREAVDASAGAEALATLARVEARLGLAAARVTAERALLAGPSAAAAHVASGDAHLAARLDEEAEAAYRRAVELEPRSATAAAGLARALAARGVGAEALEAARAAVAADPQSADALAALALAALALDPGDREGEAVVAAQQASFLEPQNPLPKLVLGRVFESREQTEQARTAYGEAAELDPSWPAPRMALLGLRLGEGDAEGALDGLRSLPQELRSTGEAELLFGRLLALDEDWTGALDAFGRAAALLPGLAEAEALRGDAAYSAGDLAAAVEAHARAAERDPGNVDYRSKRARSLAADGRREEAAAVLLDAVALPGGATAETWMALGDLYRGFEPPRVADAVAAYEKARELDPANGEALLGVARSHRAGKQWSRALAAYERIEDRFPRLKREALLGTAWCHLLSGDDTRARFYTGLAARAGADVEPLRRALQRGGGAVDDERRAELAADLRSKNAGDQAGAVKGLLALGRSAVPTLAAALGRPGTSLAARELIVDGLGRLGPAARPALAQLDRLAAVPPRAARDGESGAETALREREARLSESARGAAERIRGGGPEALSLSSPSARS